MSLTAFTRIGEYTLPAITGTHTDYVLLLRWADFDATVLSNIDDGGGDLRFSSDSAGNTQLPCEVVTFDKTANVAEVYVKLPSAATGTTVHVWGNKPQQTQPTTTNPFGRNAVWSNYLRVWHLANASNTDSTGNSDLTFTGTPTASGTTPFGGYGTLFSGSQRANYSSTDFSAGAYLTAWFKTSTASTDHNIFNSGGAYKIWSDVFGGNQRYAVGDLSPVAIAYGANHDDTWHRIDALEAGAGLRGYADGSHYGTATNGNISVNSSGTISNQSADFELKSLKASNLTPTDDYISTEYSNQTSVGAWGVMTSVAASNDVDSTISVNWPLFSVSVDGSSISPAITADITTVWPVFSFSASQGAVSPATDSDVSAIWPMLSVSADISEQVPNYSSGVDVQWPALSVTASHSTVAPDYSSSISATWPILSVSASQTQQIASIDSGVSVDWPLFDLSATQSATLPSGATAVQVEWPLFGVSVSNDITTPIFDYDVSVVWPSVSVSVDQEQTLPTGGSVVTIDWPSLAVSGEQSSTVPDYDTSITVGWPLIGVSAVSGEFDYRTDPRARITLPCEPRRITLPCESRRITL